MGRVGRHDPTDYQPIEKHFQRGEVLLDGGAGEGLLQLLDIGGNVHRLHAGQVAEIVLVAPVRESADGSVVGAAGVGVPNVGGEKFRESGYGLRSDRKSRGCRASPVARAGAGEGRPERRFSRQTELERIENNKNSELPKRDLEMEIPVKTLLFLVSMGLAAQTPTPVTLVNPGFEAPYKAVNLNGGTITGQVANGWSDGSTVNATVQYSQETTNPHGGASCQKIVVANARMQLVQKFQLQAGNIYTASVWMRGLPGTVGRLSVGLSSSPYTNYLENDVALTANWQQVSASGYITANDTAVIVIAMQTPGTLWVDDAAVSYKPGVVAPTPNLGPIPSSARLQHIRETE